VPLDEYFVTHFLAFARFSQIAHTFQFYAAIHAGARCIARFFPMD